MCTRKQTFGAVWRVWNMRKATCDTSSLLCHGTDLCVDVVCGFLFPRFCCAQLLQQLKRLICDLCRLYNLPQHPDVEMLDQPLPAGPVGQDRKARLKCTSVFFVCCCFFTWQRKVGLRTRDRGRMCLADERLSCIPATESLSKLCSLQLQYPLAQCLFHYITSLDCWTRAQ